jgi:cyclic-di-GMP phosphodiesterase, flagellum assembly factor TipF
MVRISAFFIACCMVLIAASVGTALHFRFGVSVTDSALVGLGVLCALAVYNAIAGRKHDRAEVSDQVSDIARGSGDLARQIAEFDRRLGVVENQVEIAIDRALSNTQPLAAEVEDLSRRLKHLSESVSRCEAALRGQQGEADGAAITDGALVAPAARNGKAGRIDTPMPDKVAAFRGLDRDGITALVSAAVEANKVDLYLQPIVTLPQRKVRYYEALSRLNVDGEIVAAADFLPFAAAGSVLPKLDGLSVSRCVQVVRRLLLKNRDVGLFCNLSITTLTGGGFPQLLEFLEANRAIAPSLVFEFTQSAVRAMGPVEHDNLAALAERGFRFSMDNLADLAVEPRELTDRGFRFIKVPAELLLSRIGGVGNIHPADFSDLLGRFGMDLIAEHIESEARVVELLDYDVRFGQGFLFSPPRPVRQDALVNMATVNVAGEPAKSTADKLDAAVNEVAGAAAASNDLAQPNRRPATDGNGAADLRAARGGL